MRLLWIAMIGVLLLLSCIAVSPKIKISDAVAAIPSVVAKLPNLFNAPDPCRMHMDGSGGKDNCYLNISISTRNPSTCFKIRDDDVRDNCYYLNARDSKNVATCERIRSIELKGYCRKDSAVNSSMANGCDLSAPTKRSACFLNEALATNSSFPCNLIPVDGNRQKCIAAVAGKTLDPYLCQRASNELQTDCIFDIANRTKKLDYCDLIGGKARDDCYSLMAVNFHDQALCARIANSISKDECNYFFIPTYSLPTRCFYFEEPTVRDSCYADFARINRTLSVCENVTTANLIGKETCIRDVALALGNSTLCQFLNITGIRDGCIANIYILNKTSP
ncbi:MAG: hypothetical protein AABX01_07375 [Candidatus Micrarchaeota archaeon]